MSTQSGADPGFPVGGGANPPGGAPRYDFAKFCKKNCMKLRKFWAPKSATDNGL